MRTLPCQPIGCFALMFLLSTVGSSALTPQEQSKAFFARAAAAEKRGDLVSAANCYALTLRLDGGNASAKSALVEIEKKLPAVMLEKLMTAPVYYGERNIPLSEAVDSLNRNVRYLHNPRLPGRFEIQDPTGSFAKARVTYEPPRTTVGEVLKALCEQAAARYVVEGDKIVISPKNPPPQKSLAPPTPVVAATKPAVSPTANKLAASVAAPASASPAGAAMVPTQASPSASHCFAGDTVTALNDGKEPSSSADVSIPRFTWHALKGSLEWVQYSFPQPQTIDGCSVYWYQDTQSIKLPHFWRILYLDSDGVWTPVSARPEPPTVDSWNTARFAPVRTTGLRIAAQLKGNGAAGILEWKVFPSKAQPAPQTLTEIKLGDLIPIAAKVGYGKFRVNAYDGNEEKRGARILVNGVVCENYLFAHANSEVSYAVPAGFTRFSASGVAPSLNTKPSWTYQVLGDGKPLFKGELLNTYPDREVKIDVELPAGTRTLTLIVDAAGSSTYDHAIWAEPKLLAQPLSAETKARLTQLEAQFKSVRVAKVEPAHAKAMQSLQASYLTAVLREIDKVQRAADQAGFAALQGELRLINAKQPVPDNDAPGTATALAAQRANYRASLKRLLVQRSALLAPLYEQYDAALVALAATQVGKASDLAAIAAVRASLAEARKAEAQATNASDSPIRSGPAKVL